MLQFDAERGEYEICLSNDRSFEQEAKHVMLDISEVVEGAFLLLITVELGKLSI